MDRVTSTACTEWAEAVALSAAGALPDTEEDRLAEHVAACPRCRLDQASLERVHGLLTQTARLAPRLAEMAARPAPAAARHELWQRVEQEMGQQPVPVAAGAPEPASRSASERETVPGTARGSGSPTSLLHRSRRRVAATTAALVGAAAVALGVAVPLVTGSGTNPATGYALGHPVKPGDHETVQLTGVSGVSAQAKLVATGWGTSVVLHEEGEHAGQLYRVTMRTAGGRQWSAGTYRAEPGGGTVRLHCGAGLGQIVKMSVTSVSSNQVLTGRVT